MAGRRKFLKIAGATGIAGLTGLAGCTGGGDGDGGDGTSESGGTTTGTTSSGPTELTFTLTPAESDVDVKQQYQPMFDYLESEADVSISSSVAADYAAVYSSLESGQTDIADAAPAIAIQSADNDVAEVAGIRIAYGAAKYFSLITTLPDSGIDELADLEGETVAFADRLSTSGSIFPLYMLKQAGLDTGGAPNGTPNDFEGQWSDHSQARETLINRDPVVAAGTGAFSTAPNVPKDQFPQEFLDMSAENDGDLGTESPELELLSCSNPIPRAPILIRSALDSTVRSDVTDALLAATEEDLINEDLGDDQQLWFTGLSEGTVEDYQPVRDAFDELGVELGNA
ncbi:ABC-type transport system periplasmic substrate-binding protein (probable substrate phosphate/phosphonate) [Halobacterium hubeiense]|uniref:PhnD/SsuA/transferrin family substrate-binding protein n=2 Tax=Halobacterium TaxID=2239 RepID=A0AAU8CE55_9EURY|nr:PhnD/SsuA/transferrin family substrate-binding protein [Halobacterium hubeiense]CQH61119.1 ABC-type transport system periplasmic substrate-binding protein (probable substrate phosphate/phosphonate) [Halobacterium hubeiense]